MMTKALSRLIAASLVMTTGFVSSQLSAATTVTYNYALAGNFFGIFTSDGFISTPLTLNAGDANCSSGSLVFTCNSLSFLTSAGADTITVTGTYLGGPYSRDFVFAAGSFSSATNQTDSHDVRGNVSGFFSVTTSEVDAVPEPATWAMMLLGFGAIGIAMRRRKAPIAELA